MSFVTDDIRNRIKEATSTDSIDDDTKNNFSSAINKLSKDLLDKVNNDEIHIDDVKDIKDLSAIFMNMQQSFAGAEGNGAPQASKGVSTYFNDRLNAKKQSPDQEDDEAIVSFDDLNSLSEDDITKMMDEQGKQENEDNVRKASEA